MGIGYRTIILFHFKKVEQNNRRIVFDVYDTSKRLVSMIHEMKNIEYFRRDCNTNIYEISFDLVYKDRYKCATKLSDGDIKYHSDNKAKIYSNEIEVASLLPAEFDLVVNSCDICGESTSIKGIIYPIENVQNVIKEELDKRYGIFRSFNYKGIYGLMGEEKNSIMNNYYFGIKDIKFHGVATIVFWKDGTKTVVKCHEDEKEFDVEKAIMAAFMKRALESKTGTQKDKSMDRVLGEYTAKYEKEREMENLKKPSTKKPRKKK